MLQATLRLTKLGADLIQKFIDALQSTDARLKQTLSSKICEYFERQISTKQKNLICKTWIGYIPDGEKADELLKNIRIVAMVNEKTVFPTHFKGIEIYWRQKDEVSKEMSDIASSEHKYEPCRGISGKQAEKLFEQHSNLNLIVPSSVRSRKFSTANARILEEKCIVLCCHIKGIVPLGEKTFPKAIESLSTDVREGIWSFCNGVELKLGSGITCSDTIGSVGPYINSKNGLGFLTAAHVVANSKIKNADTYSQNCAFTSKQMRVTNLSETTIGTVVDGCLPSKDSAKTSIDAAVVELEVNVRPSICFTEKVDELHDAGFTKDEIPTVRSWKILTKDDIHKKRKSQVLKIGDTTGLTSGYLYYFGAQARRVEVEFKELRLQLYNQLIVGTQKEDKSFCEKGDSGACCFLLEDDRSNNIRPFGLVIAKVNKNLGMVTPLEDIYEQFNLDINKDVSLPSKPTNRYRCSIM